MRSIIHKMVISMVLVVGYANAQKDLPVFCNDKTIPTIWPKEAASTVTGGDLVFGSSGRYSEGRIVLKNTAQQPISETIMLVELFSETGKHVLTFNVHGSTALAPKSKLPEYLQYPDGDVDSRANQGIPIFLACTTPFLLTSAKIVTACPA